MNEGFTIDEAQILLDGISDIIDSKHQYKLVKYRRTCAMVGNTILENKHRRIGVTRATLQNHTTNGLIRVLLHEVTHFLHDCQPRYKRKIQNGIRLKCHRKTFHKLEAKTKAKFEAQYGEPLPVHCW